MRAKKLLVADNQVRAKAAVKAFGLDPAEWELITWGAALAGRQFEHIVVLSPVHGWTDRHRDFLHHTLSTRMRPDTGDNLVII